MGKILAVGNIVVMLGIGTVVGSVVFCVAYVVFSLPS